MSTAFFAIQHKRADASFVPLRNKLYLVFLFHGSK
jgi:hypothetical protein